MANTTNIFINNCADTTQPVADCCGRELTAVVGSDAIGHAAGDEQHRQTLQHVLAAQRPGHVNRQALATMLIDERQQTKAPPITDPIPCKLVAPYVVSIRRPKSNARTVIQPSSPAFRLSLWDFQSLAIPQPLESLVILR